MNLAAIHRIAEQQYVKIWMLHILVHATLIQVVPGIGFNINTDRFHLSSNPKTGTGLCHRCPPSLLCRFFLFFTFPFFLLTPVMELIRDPDSKHRDNRDHIDCRAGNDNLRIYHLVHSVHLDFQIVTGGSMYPPALVCCYDRKSSSSSVAKSSSALVLPPRGSPSLIF